ncbi:hypothetical protein R6Q57_006598 [Mikania cordata]
MEKFVKFAEGYGKVNPSDDETISVPYKSPSRRRHTTDNTLCLSAIIITAIVGATVVHHQRTKPSKSEQFSSIKSSNSIKSVCAVMHQAHVSPPSPPLVPPTPSIQRWSSTLRCGGESGAPRPQETEPSDRYNDGDVGGCAVDKAATLVGSDGRVEIMESQMGGIVLETFSEGTKSY